MRMIGLRIVWALVGLAVAAAPARAQGGSVTFTEHVAPIFYESCTTCHRPGQVGPMSLLTYEDARPWARAIKQKVADRDMPPWDADPQVGTWANDRSLTDDEIATIVAWADAGAPRGDRAAMPSMPAYADSAWTIGEPDAVFSIPPFEVPADGMVEYTYFEVPTNLTEDKWVQAVQVMPDAMAAVHHIIVSARSELSLEEVEARRRVDPGIRLDREILPGDEIEWNPGVAQLEGRSKGDSLGGTTVGNDGVSIFAPGTARLLKAGTTLVFEMHYTPTGEPVVDASQIGLVFTDEEPDQVVWPGAIVHGQFAIPPGESNYKVEADLTFAKDVKLLNLLPHSHLRGVRWDYEAVYPDGTRKTILSVPEYDFNWQIDYIFDEPLSLPKGSKIHAVSYYDNSAANRHNPDPTVEVRWGEQTDEEMMFTALSYLIDEEAGTVPTQQQQ